MKMEGEIHRRYCYARTGGDSDMMYFALKTPYSMHKIKLGP